MFSSVRAVVLLLLTALVLLANGCTPERRRVSEDLSAIFGKPIYQRAVWGLRVVDLDSGQVLYDLNPDRRLLIGSVRKVFSVGVFLNAVGPGHTFVTAVYRQGPVSNGRLAGNLVLVASGDLTMGGREHPDGTIAITDLDHNEANALGNAQLTAPDPLAGYAALARQVAASGITEVDGDVIIDARLFVPFKFRGEFDVSPIFVNDDVVDVAITPGAAGTLASVQWRPRSAAFEVVPDLMTLNAGTEPRIDLVPEIPTCFGRPGCRGKVSGQIPVDLVPPMTNALPLVRTFRIADPASYARTVFVEALRTAGVNVKAPAVGLNPVDKLPPRNSYATERKVAELVSFPYAAIAKLILKVSYNIGADTSLVLFGLTRGADDMRGALAAERSTLAADFGINVADLFFVDGSGGGLTSASTNAVTAFLLRMSKASSFTAFRDALPVLGVDGSLASATDFKQDPTLSGAEGNVLAKTGTFIEGTAAGPVFRAKALAGYIQAKSGRRLAFVLVANDIGLLKSLDDLFRIVQDQGTIAAILWRDY